MNSEVKMSVSSMTRTGDKKAVYVMFQDGDKSAEYSLPGFNDSELNSLKEYIENEQDSIYAMAKGVNPIKALMGDTGKT